MGELVGELNRLAGTSGLEAAGAANVIAGTSALELVGALNVAAGTDGLELGGACRALAALYGGDDSLDAAGALASIEGVSMARTTWAAAGGAAPTFTALDTFGAFGGAVQPALGTSPTQDSSFSQVGKECYGSCRILWGTSPTVGAGYYALTGLPVAPKITTGQGRPVGYGFWYDASTNLKVDVYAVLDPLFSTTLPMIFMHYQINTATDPDELGPVGGADASWFYASNMPVIPAVGDILNLTFQYEGV